MIFAHSQDQLDLRDGARDYLRGRCTVEALREMREFTNGKPKSQLDVWSELSDLGLLGYMVSEQNGGLGLDEVGFTLLCEEVGYVALPEPITDVAGLCLPLLDQCGAEEVSTILNGEKRVRSMHSLNPYVNHFEEGDDLLVLSDESIRLVSASELKVVEVDSIDPLRKLSKIEMDQASGRVLMGTSQASVLVPQLCLRGALFSASELLGLTARMIDMATEYAKERQQFGKPIGSYQAVKHHLASAFVKLEFAKPVVYKASADLAKGVSNADVAVAHAKIAATDAAINAAEVAIQVHGGMGYTFEVDLHLWMKRAWALSGQWGDRNHHMNIIDTAIIDNRMALGPSENF